MVGTAVRVGAIIVKSDSVGELVGVGVSLGVGEVVTRIVGVSVAVPVSVNGRVDAGSQGVTPVNPRL